MRFVRLRSSRSHSPASRNKPLRIRISEFAGRDFRRTRNRCNEEGSCQSELDNDARLLQLETFAQLLVLFSQVPFFGPYFDHRSVPPAIAGGFPNGYKGPPAIAGGTDCAESKELVRERKRARRSMRCRAHLYLWSLSSPQQPRRRSNYQTVSSCPTDRIATCVPSTRSPKFLFK